MKFGIAVTTSVTPAVEAEAQADYVRRVAEATEQSGFDSVWVSDRTVFPTDLSERYPDRFGPGKADPEAQNLPEAVSTLSYVAGVTQSVRLGFSVLVLPFRNPVLNAKMVTTLDVLSAGRVIFGVGSGWMPEEFEAMGASHPDRGATTDEHLEVFRALCADDVPEDLAERFNISGMRFFPLPIQKPHPPVWVGGNSERIMRRAARYGDAWHPIRLTPDELADSLPALRRACEEEGRSVDDLSITLRATADLGSSQQGEDGLRVPLTGGLPEITDDMKRYEDAGLEYIVLSVSGDSTGVVVDRVHQLAKGLSVGV